MNDAPALPGESGRRPGKASRRSCQEAVTGPGGSRVRRSARIFAHALSPRSHAMRSALMYGTIATLVLGLAACAEPPAPTAPPRPSFATGRHGPSLFVTDVSRDTAAQDETPIAVNPRNANNILTGANDFNLNDGRAYNVSFDGGRTWSPTLPNGFIPGLTLFTNDPAVPGTGSYEIAGDPAVAFGPDGTAYFACQAFSVTSPFPIALFVNRSTDGGLTWADGVHQKPVQVSAWNGNGKSRGGNGQFPDHDAMTVDDNPGSPFYGSVYVTWVQFSGLQGTHSPVLVAFSRDGARSFSQPVKVTQGPVRNNQDARIVIGPDGTLYLAFDNGVQGGKGTANYVVVSRDGGVTWSTPVAFSFYNNPVCLFPPFCFNLSGSPFRAPSSYPAPAFDRAANRLAVAFSDIDTDGRAKIFVMSAPADRVTDAGAWSRPVVLAGSGDRFGAELGAAPGGRYDLSFYDRGYSGNALVDLTYATSADGGATWAATRVTDSGFDPSLYRTRFIGDYNGIVSLGAGAALAWTGVGTTNGVTNFDVFFGSAKP